MKAASLNRGRLGRPKGRAPGTLEPLVLRTLDAIHLATALAVGDDLDAIVTYDDRMLEAARLIGSSAVSPR